MILSSAFFAYLPLVVLFCLLVLSTDRLDGFALRISHNEGDRLHHQHHGLHASAI